MMDPKACLARMIRALDDNDLAEAEYAREDLDTWARRGGAMTPEIWAGLDAATERLIEARQNP